MGKSITATLLGILLNRGGCTHINSVAIALCNEVALPGDDEGCRQSLGCYPDHLYLYTGGINSYHYAATRPQQWLPNTVGRYRNTDPVLISYLIRLAVEKSGEEYL